MGIPHILYDPIYTDSAQSSASPLTPAQIQLDNTVLNLSNQASDVTTLGLMIAGGGVSKGIQSLGAAKLLPLAGQSRFASTLFKSAITGASIAGESATFVVGERGLNVAFFGGDPSQLRWKGESGIEKAWKTSFVNFAGFRFGGKAFANQNAILQVFGNSSTLVAANQLTGALGLTPVSHDDLSTQMIHSTLTYLQMQSSGQLLHVLSPGSAQAPFDLTKYLETAKPIRLMSDLSSEPALPVLRSGQQMSWFEKISLERLQTALPKAKPETILTIRFRFLLALLGPQGKLSYTQNLLKTLLESDSSENSINFAHSALPEAFKDLPLEQKAILIDQIKGALHNSSNPNFTLRYMFALQQMLPTLTGDSRLAANCLLIEALISPYLEVSKQADSVLNRSISKLSESDLMKLGDHLRTLEFVPQIAGKRVRDLITLIAFEINAKASTDAAKTVNVAQWFGQFIDHPQYRLGTSASHSWLLLLKTLPPEKARALIEQFKANFPSDLSGYLHWAITSDGILRDRSVPLDEISKSWYEQRRDLAIHKFRNLLYSFELPKSWTELGTRIRSISTLEEALDFQKRFQLRMQSNDPHTQVEIEQWWKKMEVNSRWQALQLLVGPDQYIQMKGKEAMRWRSLVSMGVPYETGIASTQRQITSDDNTIFILGNPSSIGLPETLSDKIGADNASKYFILHHTHPVFDHVNDIVEIYPSSFLEGYAAAGDMVVLLNQFNKLNEGENIALSITHPIGGFSLVNRKLNASGGSIFVLRKMNGNPVVDIYTGIKPNASLSQTFKMEDPRFVQKRENIRRWAEGRQVDLHFYEIPYEWVESITYPTLLERTQPDPTAREISH